MNKIKIAQVGTGHPHASGAAAAFLADPAFELIGFAEPSPDYRHPENPCSLDSSTLYSGMKQYSVEELLAMEELDAVAIECEEENATKYALLFAEKGIHIYMDKPGSHGYTSFERLINTCKKSGSILKMGYMYRYNPLVMKARELAASGALGEIYAVEAQMSLLYPEAMCRWIGKHRGGMMYYLGCHDIDLVLQFMGTLPEEIIPLNTSTSQYGLDSENYGFAVLKYPKGVSFVKTTCAEHNGFPRRQLVVCGTRGTVEIKPIETFLHGITLKSEAVITIDGKTEHIESAPFDRYSGTIRAFADHITGKSENPFTYDYELGLFKTLMACCSAE